MGKHLHGSAFLRRAPSLTLPRRFLRGGYGRLALTVVALSSGVALVCAMDLGSRAVLQAFVEVVDTMAGRAALAVTANGAPMPEQGTDQIAGVPGVELVAPVVNATALVADGSGELLTVFGVDVTNDAAVSIYEARDAGGLKLDDPLTFLNQPDSIVITRALAVRRSLRVGDSLDLLTPTGRRAFTVRGLLEPLGIARAYGGNLVVMDLPAAEAAFIRPRFVNRFDVVLRRDARVDETAAAIGRQVPAGWRVEAPDERKADLQRVMASLQVMLSAVSLVALAAAFLIILNRLNTAFETRAWQLGILRAVGMRARAVWWELLKESLLVGAIGVALGIPLGIAIGHLLLPVVATTAALNLKLIATQADLAVHPQSLAIAALLGIGTAVLAAALPAWRIARRPPVEIVRGRGIAPRRSRGLRWPLYAGLGTAIVATLAAQRLTHNPAWGLLATVLIVVAAVVSARPLLALAAPPILGGLRAVLGPSANIARATFAQNSGRAVLTVAMIGVGIGAIIWLRMLAYSFEISLVDALSVALQGDWIIGSSHAAQGYLEAPIDERLVADVIGVRGVGDAVGERLVDWPYGDGPVALDAFDARYFTTSAFGRWPLIGAADPQVWEELSAGSAVLISSSFSVNLGARVGDVLHLDTPSGPLAVPVAGITADFASPRGTIVLSRDLYRARWNDGQVNRAFVRVSPGTDPSAVRTAIAADLGTRYGLRIISANDLMQYFAEQVRRAFAPVGVLAGLLLFVLLLGLADTLAASVLERTRELAIVRTLGSRRTALRRAVIAEGLGLGVPGVLLALIAGLALGTLWVQQTFPFLLGWALETHIPYAEVALVSAATLVVCWGAGILPARRAAALNPVQALRYE
jgi:putative ABC transport system permease protein